MQNILDLLNPSTVHGAIICSVIGGIILMLFSVFKRKDNSNKNHEEIKIDGDVKGDFNYKNKVKKSSRQLNT